MGKRAFLILSLIIAFSGFCIAGESNDLRTLFLNNQSNILGINIRTFNAKDLNGNEIIDANEESGNFLNAIERLDEIKGLGINTIHLLPITPVGKLKALGTAGSLYAIADFESINEQLIDKNSALSPKEQVKKFINECHKRGIRVIADLPSCGSYDLFLKRPELFIKNDKNVSIVPTDWTDVRLLNTGNNDKLNQDVLDVHKKFIDMVINLGFDGIRADVATIKPSGFWEEIIKYAREKDKEFMFLAEASDSWREPPSKYAEFTPYDELLNAGFDGYYGSFFNLKEWNANELIEHIKFNNKLLKSYNEPKSVIMSFATHDEISPVIVHGKEFSVMIAWLEAILPYNPYAIDGFPYGDEYIYPWANNKAEYTQTDDDTYFVHRGKPDIFNFSRALKGGKKGINKTVLTNFKDAYKFRAENIDLVTNGDFTQLKTKDNKIFAIMITQKGKNPVRIIALGNLDFKNTKENVTIKIPKLKKTSELDFVHGDGSLKIHRNRLHTSLTPGEIEVVKIDY